MHGGVSRRQELLRATSRISSSAPFAACCLCQFEASALPRVQSWWPRMPQLEGQRRLPVPPAGGQLTSGSSRKATQTEVEHRTPNSTPFVHTGAHEPEEGQSHVQRSSSFCGRLCLAYKRGA